VLLLHFSQPIPEFKPRYLRPTLRQPPNDDRVILADSIGLPELTEPHNENN
jgi:hypothetical protein